MDGPFPCGGIAVNLRKLSRKKKTTRSLCEEAASRRGNLLPEADIITLVAIGRRLPRHSVPRNDSGGVTPSPVGEGWDGGNQKAIALNYFY